jgi:integrase
MVSYNPEEAEQVRTGIIRDLDMGIYVPPSSLSLNAQLDEWLKEQRNMVTVRTLDGYAGSFDRYIRGPIGKKKLANLKASEIQAVYNEMSERRLSATTIRHAHVALKCALKRAVELGLIPRSPADPVKVAKIVRKERHVFTPEDAVKFLETSAKMPHGLIFEFSLLTGMRPEEYLALQWKDIDFNKHNASIQRVLLRHKGKVSFEKPKTDKSRRSILLPKSLVKKLAEHKRSQAEGRLRAGPLWQNHNLVFCSEIGTPLQIPHLTYRYFRPILVEAELPQIRLYDLRHVHATLLLMADENPKVVSERLGHSTVKLTMDTYSHVLPTMQERATEKLEKLLYGQSEEKLKSG